MTFSFGCFSLVPIATLVLACNYTEPLGPLDFWRDGLVLYVIQVVSINVSVSIVAIGGGCCAIRTPDGDYEPANLPEKYRVNGLRVHVVLRGTRAGSFCMIAPVVTLDSVRTL